MKGILFTEFLEMVEDTYGLAMMDRVIEGANLPNGGAYTSVGNYNHRELLKLAGRLSMETRTPLPQLMETFADRIFKLFARRYGHLMAGAGSCFDFLGQIESYIHVEVSKLYPDAELPAFTYPEHDESRLVMEYRSPRPMSGFAEGLLRAAIRHYGEPIALTMEDLSEGHGTSARFTLIRRPA